MSKKRGKSGSARGRGGNWEMGLLTTPLVEENWTVCIHFLVENDVLDEAHVKALNDVVKIPQRKLFSHLRKEDLLQQVEELGNPKNKKPPTLPQFCEITEVMYGLMAANQEIPLPLWAKLIKYGLLNIKANDLLRRENELRAKEEKAAGGGGKGSAKKRPRSKSPGKKGKKTPESSAPKKDWSKLKKRGEDGDEQKYIDDEPDDGPQHYVFISGFRKAQLLPILEELGITVNGVIKIQSESYGSLESLYEEKKAIASEGLSEEDLIGADLQRQEEIKELALFWKLLPVVLSRATPVSKLQDLGCHKYTVTDIVLPACWDDAENMNGFGTAIFEDLACLMYDNLDHLRQYLNYIKNINLLHVPKLGELPPAPPALPATPEPQTVASPAPGKANKGKLAPPTDTLEVSDSAETAATPAPTEVDTRYYHDLMDEIPMEAVSVPLLMHCVLEQVVATEEEKIPPSEVVEPARPDGLHLSLAECIANALQSVSLTEEEEKILEEDFPTLKKKNAEEAKKFNQPQGPALIRYGDETAVRTLDLPASETLDPSSAEKAMLHRTPSAKYLISREVSAMTNGERSARLHELLRHTTTFGAEGNQTNVSANDMDRAMRQFVFESMDLSTVDEQSKIVPLEDTSDRDNVWDDPYTLVIRKDTSEAELDSSRRLDNYSFTEHLKTPLLIQNLEEARQQYPCVDTYHHKRDNSLLLYYHYPMSDELKACTQWFTSLHSDVGFRNYLDYVAGDIANWTKSEEEKYQAELIAAELEKAREAAAAKAAELASTPPPTAGGKRPRSKSPKKGSKKGSRKASPSRASSKAGLNEPQYSSPFIREGSLKAEKEVKDKARAEEEAARKEKEERASARSGRPKSGGKRGKSASSKSGSKDRSSKERPKSGGSGGKRSKSRGKSRSKSRSRSRSRSSERSVETTPSKVNDPSLPFTGYDVGNDLIHVRGGTTYLYPCDGGTITSEKVEVEQGPTSVKAAMHKDGHCFVVHVLEPRDHAAEAELDKLLYVPPVVVTPREGVEKAETESQEKDQQLRPESSLPPSTPAVEKGDPSHSLFASWCATLLDGMTMSLSCHGDDGVSEEAVETKEKLLKLLGDIPPASSPSPVPPGMESPGKKGKKSPRGKSPRGKSPKGKKKNAAELEAAAEAERLEQIRQQEELERKLAEAAAAEEEERRRRALPQFQQLYLSCPDGLSMRYYLDPSSEPDDLKLMVRQSYQLKRRNNSDQQEVSRLYRSDGSVVKVLFNGNTKVLYPDGTVCFNKGSGPVLEPEKPKAEPSSKENVIFEDLPVPPTKRGASAGSKRGSKGRKSSGKTDVDKMTEGSSLEGTLPPAARVEAEVSIGVESEQGTWLTTYMNGDVTLTKPGEPVTEQSPLCCFKATDPVTKEVLYTREDKTIRVDRPDGTVVCDHEDGTRITQYFAATSAQGDAVRHIRIECPNFATVVFNTDTNTSEARFGSGSCLAVQADGSYALSHWSGGQIDILPDSTVAYTPRPDNDFFTAGNFEEGEATTRTVVSGSYVMRHNAPVVCEAVDQEGNIFQVKNNGEVSVVNQANIDYEDCADTPKPPLKPSNNNPSAHHAPRLFVIHNDGTGTEYLRPNDIQDYIFDAEIDPTTAVIKEPLSEHGEVTGITVMRPHYGKSGEAWQIPKEEGSIIPPLIRNRDLTTFPPNENIKPGPKFATQVGKGLAVGDIPRPPQTPPAPTCPSALEVRQLVQYPLVSEELRKHLQEQLLKFGKTISAQEAERESLKVYDPRTEEEKIRAQDLLTLVLQLDDDQTPRSDDGITSDRDGLAPSAGYLVANAMATAAIPDKQNSVDVKLTYEAAVKPPPMPEPPKPQPKLTQADWDIIRRELEEEKAGREQLKNKYVPAYFESEEGKAWLLTRATTIADAQLATDPRTDGTEARMNVVGKPDGATEEGSSTAAAAAPTDKSSKVRPTNPTPVSARGGGTPTKVRPDNPTPISAGSQRNNRPSNPSPKTAAQHSIKGSDHFQPSPIPENPTSAQRRAVASPKPPTTEVTIEHITTDGELDLSKSLYYDALGQPRSDAVRLPAAILTDKTGAIPNTKFLEVEEPVRRKVKTSSVAGGLMMGHTKVAERGFQLFPPEVVFGVLKEGTTYGTTVKMQNTGIDLCRFKIRQPPPGTGIRVNYSPGPVAAGMDTSLDVEIYAIAVGVEGDSGIGTIHHQLEIVTETDILVLPITAIVLTAHDHDNRSDGLPQGGKAPGVRVCAKKPPSRESFVRPSSRKAAV